MASIQEPSVDKPLHTAYDSDESKYASESDEDLDDIGEYCFETGRLAYKANDDYKNVIESIVVLRALRAQAVRDKQRLIECREKALADPLEFVEKLKRKEDLGLPRPLKLPQIPLIDWSKYSISENSSSAFVRRQLNMIAVESSARRGKLGSNDAESLSASNFNKPWTTEEQQKLEKFLIEYPPEEVETRRWEKISAALGTRSPTQVASRVQKYFVKLAKAGAPIPGKPPSWSYRSKLKNTVGGLSQKHPPTDTDLTGSHIDNQSSDEVSDEDDITPDLRTTPEYKELLLVKKVLRKKMKQAEQKRIKRTKIG